MMTITGALALLLFLSSGLNKAHSNDYLDNSNLVDNFALTDIYYFIWSSEGSNFNKGQIAIPKSNLSKYIPHDHDYFYMWIGSGTNPPDSNTYKLKVYPPSSLSGNSVKKVEFAEDYPGATLLKRGTSEYEIIWPGCYATTLYFYFGNGNYNVSARFVGPSTSPEIEYIKKGVAVPQSWTDSIDDMSLSYNWEQLTTDYVLFTIDYSSKTVDNIVTKISVNDASDSSKTSFISPEDTEYWNDNSGRIEIYIDKNNYDDSGNIVSKNDGDITIYSEDHIGNEISKKHRIFNNMRPRFTFHWILGLTRSFRTRSIFRWNKK